MGLFLTTIYLVIVVGIAIYNCKIMIALTPYEWGDYLAGVFGPLALIWLVLGFFQQGDELRYSAEALWLQGEELRNSVEQQRALVEATRQQVDFEKASLESQRLELEQRSQPIFKIFFTGETAGNALSKEYNFVISNVGEECTDVSFEFSGDIIWSNRIIERGSAQAHWINLRNVEDLRNIQLIVRYFDRLGGRKTLQFTSSDGINFKTDIAEN